MNEVYITLTAARALFGGLTYTRGHMTTYIEFARREGVWKPMYSSVLHTHDGYCHGYSLSCSDDKLIELLKDRVK